MPLAFPSHQGLIAPLWRRWPDRFDALAMSTGAAAPDIVDGARALVQGHLGQGVAVSAFVGAFSHLAFDFVSHDKFLWLLPWYEDPKFFPSFWYARWFEIRTPFYDEPYAFGPHFLVWLALSVIGAGMFFRRPRSS